MGLFKKTASLKDVVLKLITHSKGEIDKINNDANSIPSGDLRSSVIAELLALVLIAHRLGIQNSGLEYGRMSEILRVFDQFHSSKMGADLQKHLDLRGPQYHSLCIRHKEELRRFETKEFSISLAQAFTLFAFGEKGMSDDPLRLIELGVGITDVGFLGKLANTYWSRCYWETIQYLLDCNFR